MRSSGRWLGALVVLFMAVGCANGAEPGATTTEVSEPATTATTAITATSTPEGTTATSVALEEDQVVLVAIGDSIPYNAEEDCPGCVGFVDDFGDYIATTTGTTVEVHNLSRHDGAGTEDLAVQVVNDSALRDILGAADIVLISIGINDQAPFPDPSHPCYIEKPTDSDEEWIEALRVMTPECIDQRHADLRPVLASVFADVRELAPDARVGALTAYNWHVSEAVAESGGDEVINDIAIVTTYGLQSWNALLCEEAATVEIECIDVYLAFNGLDGLTPAGDHLAADYAHPSQKGNDVIRDLLIASDLVG